MSADFDAAVGENWRRTLDRIPTVPGRLAFLASLRSASTGTYEHFGLAQRIGAPATDGLLRRVHREIFEEWLCFNLERQKEELEEYIAGLHEDRQEIIRNWLHIKPWISWIPAESRDVERSLFDVDFSAVLEVLRAEYGVASRDPDL